MGDADLGGPGCQPDAETHPVIEGSDDGSRSAAASA